MPKQVIIGYMPVIHRGYLQFFDAFPAVKDVYIIDRSRLDDETVDYLRKDLRQLGPRQMVTLLEGLKRFESVSILPEDLDVSELEIIMPDEDISHAVASQFVNASVTYFNTFLRWDRRSLTNINAEATDENSTDAQEHVDFMNQAVASASKSVDIWRRVGALLVDDEKNVFDFACNQGESTNFSPWIEGDPRNIFNRGVGIEMSVFTHAEAIMVARAARHGVSLQNARIYVTDFPCPACAKLIAHSGITHVYYKDGYAVLDGQRVLNDYGVELIRVQVTDLDDQPEVWVPYNKS